MYLNNFKQYWRANPLQTLILLISVAVGVAALVAMLQIKAMTVFQIERKLAQMGVHHSLLTISPKPTNSGAYHPITLSTLEIDKKSGWLPGINLIPYQYVGVPVMHQGKTVNGAMVIATKENLRHSLNLSLAHGRFFSTLDDRQPVVVLNTSLAHQIDPDLHNVIGQFVQLGEKFFYVIGILAPMNNVGSFEYDINQCIWIPLSSMSLLEQTEDIRDIIAYYPDMDTQDAMALLNTQLPNLFPEHQHWLRNNDWLLEDLKKQGEQVCLMLQVIAVITSLMAMNSLINVTLLSIWQRREEFGIRTAIGATPRHLLISLLQESLTLSSMGTIAGCFIGIVMAWYFSRVWQWTYQFSIPALLFSSLAAIALMTLAACYPAYRTIRLKPIELLQGG